MKIAFTEILIVLMMIILLIGPIIILFVLLVRTLLKYLKRKEDSIASAQVIDAIASPETAQTLQSLGEALKNARTARKFTQEYVADTLGVSRQAVSKWENGTSDPSTSNLIALAKLYEVSVEALLANVTV